jgi:hypothetical protein
MKSMFMKIRKNEKIKHFGKNKEFQTKKLFEELLSKERNISHSTTVTLKLPET